MNTKMFCATFTSIASLLLLSGCTLFSADTAELSASCDDAFKTASADMTSHYATHPLFGPEYDSIYEDGVVTDEEKAALSAMVSDEEAKFAALVDPVYDACSGVEELYAGAFKYRNEADWALQENEHMSRESNKNIFVTSYCFGFENRPACSDFDINEWK